MAPAINSEMKQTVVVWLAIVLLSVCLLYPPYGYTRYEIVTDYTPSLHIPREESTEHVAWTYVRHAFLFDAPPAMDARLDSDYKSSDSKDSHTFISILDMGVGWPIVIVEGIIIVSVATGVIFTIGRIGRRA